MHLQHEFHNLHENPLCGKKYFATSLQPSNILNCPLSARITKIVPDEPSPNYFIAANLTCPTRTALFCSLSPFFTHEHRCYPPLDLSTCTTRSLCSQFPFIGGRSVYPPRLAHSLLSSCQYSALRVMLLTHTSEERKKKIHTLGLLRGFSQWNVLLSDKFLKTQEFPLEQNVQFLRSTTSHGLPDCLWIQLPKSFTQRGFPKLSLKMDLFHQNFLFRHCNRQVLNFYICC